jgi:hypothetical protein
MAAATPRRLVSVNVRIPADLFDHSRSKPSNIPSAPATKRLNTFVSIGRDSRPNAAIVTTR